MLPLGSTNGISVAGRDFAEVCSILTGFDSFDLLGTGMSDVYLRVAQNQVGHALLTLMLETASRGTDLLQGPQLEAARAVTYLWYTGAWPEVNRDAFAEFEGELKNNTETIASPQAYTEGLVWRTFHGHPAGAKAPGFGTWTAPPSLEHRKRES